MIKLILKFLTCAALLAIICLSVNAATNIASYPLEVQVKCSSDRAAQMAELKFLPLPQGKKVAFSCRWDDNSLKHARMKKLMTKYGYKGTFYLTNPPDKFKREVLPELCKDGCTIGNHSMSHFYLPFMSPNGIFYDIMQARILHENLSNLSENACVLPNGNLSSIYFPDAPQIISSCLRRSGMLGGPDWAALEINKMPNNEYFNNNGCGVYPGDTNTNPQKFDAHVQKHLSKAGEVVHMNLGIHVWYSDKDFANLEESLQKYAYRPDWWYCNENEFNAYSYMFRHAKVVDKKVNGDTVIFTLAMPYPEFLGSDVSLYAECDGKLIEIKHTRKMPEKIAVADVNGIVDKFPDIISKIFYVAPNKIRLELENHTSPMNDVQMILRLPPAFMEETLYLNVGQITEKFSYEWSVTPNSKWQSNGKELTALQIDFTRDDIVGRIWTSHIKDIPVENKYNIKVYYSNNVFTKQNFTELAIPETLINSQEFKLALQEINNREGVYLIPENQPRDNGLTVLMEFNGGEKMCLRGTLPNEIYCNGKKIKAVNKEFNFNAPFGKCRLLLHYEKNKLTAKYLKLLLSEEK